MTTSMALASLLLLFLASIADGIRLDRQLREAINKQKMVHPTTPCEASIARSVIKHCSPNDGRHCSSPAGPTKNPLTRAESGAAVKRVHVDSSSTAGSGRGGDTANVVVDAYASTTQQQGRQEEVRTARSGQVGAAATPRVPWQRQSSYPDIIDVAGMDYSPATRRSPIHN